VARYKLLIAYEGTHYHGWQVQPNGISIQSSLENVLKIILRKEVRIFGAGRTDAGVHALGQAAHFIFDDPIDLHKLLGSMNGLLPTDIRILSVERVEDSFHAQYSAAGKIYRYHLHLQMIESPFKRGFAWHIPYPLDLKAMQEAARMLIGRHDFTAFANESHRGVAAHDPVRTLQRIDFIDEPGGVYLEFEGEGFLYMMVRNIVGTLVEIGSGKRPPQEIERILASKDRRQAGQAAPPQGLFLVKVLYPQTRENEAPLSL
jgi:tRNA pseudouridine38-40 synthase